jgi:DnaK suppressor protein
VSKSKAESTAKKASSGKGREAAASKSKTRKPASPADGETMVAEKGPAQARKTKKAPTGSKSVAPASEVVLPEDYRPSDKEPFMNDRQLHYFRNKLIAWKEDIIRQTRETLQGMTSTTEHHADIADRATSETDRALELRARDRQRKLVSKINAALARIDDGSYGYCEETGEPIGLRRLEARPIATLSLEAQERHERRERVFRED